jgi:hypothetical protein
MVGQGIELRELPVNGLGEGEGIELVPQRLQVKAGRSAVIAVILPPVSARRRAMWDVG